MAARFSPIRFFWNISRHSATRNGLNGVGHPTQLLTVLPVLALLATVWANAAHGQTVYTIITPAPVDRIIATNKGAFIQSGGKAFAVVTCDADARICLKPSNLAPSQYPAPVGALPDGRVAISDSGDIRQAWFARPTTRYTHGVLGDAIEAESLVVVTASGTTLEAVLPDDQVFEDITPRIADLDGDGTNEVIAIRSSTSAGAGVAIYGLIENQLAQRGAGSENGRPNRWLNIAGLIPRADGGLTLYGVRTPHIGGRLFSLDFRDGQFIENNDIATDVSNHIIGSRELGMSATGQFGHQIELVLPSQNRRRLRFPLTGRADIALPASIDKAIVLVDGRVVTATTEGTLIVVSP
ncbi:hypothetical protein IMCC20628_02809 [Hoeflea sp. IMCC20628]|uniref:hypothetical protein n=1 Tax=Hoeflea sp. IMCC20628 TaxID=1620421 RepID=UPI00063BD338|nr:hypothetical protein [Hoeflea sp. IMCC20628]AKI01504.1 hypothetical protein IMCC20628_02809 [Hoeflea sp. IMCC20628]